MNFVLSVKGPLANTRTHLNEHIITFMQHQFVNVTPWTDYTSTCTYRSIMLFLNPVSMPKQCEFGHSKSINLTQIPISQISFVSSSAQSLTLC